MGPTSVKEREEIEESQDGHESDVYLPPHPRFLLRCERRRSERVSRVGLALQAMLDVRRWFFEILLRSHRKRRSRRGAEGGGGEGRGILGGKPKPQEALSYHSLVFNTPTFPASPPSPATGRVKLPH